MNTGQPKFNIYHKNCRTLFIPGQFEECVLTGLSKTSPCSWRRTSLWNSRSIEMNQLQRQLNSIYLLSHVRILNTSIVLFSCLKGYWILQIIYWIPYFFLFTLTHYSPCMISVCWAWGLDWEWHIWSAAQFCPVDFTTFDLLI